MLYRPCLTLLAIGLLAGCPGDDDPLANACGTGFDPDTGTVSDFGTADAAQKVEALLRASSDLHLAANATEKDIREACVAMATDLGVPATELQPGAGELAVTKACSRLVTEIDAIVATMPVNATLGITITPASCTVNLDVAAMCAGECDASITGDATVECKGELHGTCTGGCSGECAVMGTANCAGECSGTCTGECSGTCNGTCTSGCSLRDNDGNCIGTCSGTCTGTCSATCSGSCTGTCTAEVTGACTGECYGSCDASWMAECNGEANVMANAECKAACDARANATATCDPPSVTIRGVAVADSAKAARITALVTTLTANYPKLLRAQSRVQFSIAPGAASFVTAVKGAATSLKSVGVQAAACMGVAVDTVVEAAATVDASVSVSVEVSASVSASGSGG